MADTPDCSDLKTFDVPDPPKDPTWKLRALLCAGLGLGATIGAAKATALPHRVWVCQHWTSGWGNDKELDYRQRYSAEELAEDYSAEQLLPYVREMQPLKLRGFFGAALASTGDQAHVDALLAYVKTVQGYEVEKKASEWFGYLQKLDEPRAVREFMRLYAKEPADAYAPRELQQAAFVALAGAPAPLVLAELKTIEEPARRGRFHALMATTRDAAWVDDILAYAATVIPSDPERAADDDDWAPLVKSLSVFDAAATPRLHKALEDADSRSMVCLAAAVLRSSDLPFLIQQTTKGLDEFDAMVPKLSRADAIINAEQEGKLEGVEPEVVAGAKKLMADAEARSFITFEMLKSLAQVKGSDDVDFCFVRGLSTFNQRIAQWCVQRIKERLPAQKLVDTLFSYMAQKTQFKVPEVEAYESLVRELGAEGGAGVVRNLERLLEAAKDDPGEVFWLYKKMGITLLGELGDQGALAVLKKLERDPGSYSITSTDGQGRRSEKEIKYRDEAKKAIAAIQARAPEGE